MKTARQRAPANAGENMNEKEAKKAIRGAWTDGDYGLYEGKRHVRIHKNGTVERYGQMPNSQEIGWWFAGYLKDYMSGKRIID